MRILLSVVLFVGTSWGSLGFAAVVGSGESHHQQTDMGRIPVGSSEGLRQQFRASAESPDVVTSLSLSGDAGFKITRNRECVPGGNLGYRCTFEVEFTPTSVGQKTATAQYFFLFEGEAPGVVTKTFTVSVVPREAPGGQACAQGSIIQIDTQTLREFVPLAGTPFSFFYASENAEGFESESPGLGRRNEFNPDYWTISDHHFLDPQLSRLYRGDGTAEVRPQSRGADGRIMVLENDGSAVYFFDQNGRHLETRNPLLGSLRYRFDYSREGFLSVITDAFGNKTRFVRVEGGGLQVVRAPFGQETRVRVNAEGLINEIIQPDGRSYLMTYHRGELLRGFQKPDGTRTAFAYDRMGRLWKDVGTGGNSWTLEREELANGGYVLKKISQMGKTSRFEISFAQDGTYQRREVGADTRLSAQFDWTSRGSRRVVGNAILEDRWVGSDPRFGGLLSVPRGGQTTVGQVAARWFETSTVVPETPSDPFKFLELKKTRVVFGEESTEVFDYQSKMFHRNSAEGVRSEGTLDQNERLIRYGLADDVRWQLEYDERGRLKSVGQEGRLPTEYIYGDDGFLKSVLNPFGQRTVYERDQMGRPVRVTLPGARVVVMDYDVMGRLTGVTPPGRARFGFIYNNFGTLATETAPQVGSVASVATRYEYNQDMQVTGITRPDGARVDLLRGEASGLVREAKTPRGRYTYLYEPETVNLASISSPDGILSSFRYYGFTPAVEVQADQATLKEFARMEYAFDPFHRPMKRAIKDQAGETISEWEIGYNKDGVISRLDELELSYHGASGRLSGRTLRQVQEKMSYNRFGELSFLAVTAPSGDRIYGFELHRDEGGRINRKVEEIMGQVTAWGYVYDPAGRLIEVLKDGVTNKRFEYDENGNRTVTTVGGAVLRATYDEQDRMTTWGADRSSYNANGDLVATESAMGVRTEYSRDVFGNLLAVNAGGGAKERRMLLDGRNRTVARLFDGAIERRYIYEDDFRVAAQFDGQGQGFGSFGHVTSVNSPDFMAYKSLRFLFIRDHLGSPRLIVNADTGAVVQRLDYSEWGEVIYDSNPGFQPYGFAGGLYDWRTGLVRFGAREYDPKSGRWTSKDPIGFAGGDTNLFGYVANDPVNFVDPSGLILQGIISQITTPSQQAVVAAGFAAAGTFLAQSAGPAAGVNPLAALGFAGLSALAFNEAYQNGKMAVDRGLLNRENLLSDPFAMNSGSMENMCSR